MTQDLKLFIIIMIVNLLLVAAYIIWNILQHREERFAVVVKVLVMLVCPIAGPLFILVGYIAYRLFFSQAMDLDDVVFNKEKSKVYMHADEERERNMVSMEEALAVTDKINLRKLMMNVVRGDVKKSLSSISLALNSEDSETSHYAASVLQDELNNFRGQTQQEYRELKNNSEFQASRAVNLLHFMNDMLVQHVFTAMEQESMVKMMEEVAAMLYENEPLLMSCYDFEAVCLRLLDIQAYEACEEWCQRSVKNYPSALSTYTCRMKLYYYTGRKDEFFVLLEELRTSNIVIDKETLEMIRIFS